ncbi:14414_t:CDS:1, partial [Gigaspora margarita]
DVPNGTSAQQIRRNLSFYSKATVRGFIANRKTKAAYLEMEFKNKRREKKLAGAWVVHFDG